MAVRPRASIVRGSAAPPAKAAAAAPAEPEPAVRKAQFAELEREAFAKGFAQGEKSGQEAADQRSEAMLRRLTDTLQELTQLRSQMIHQTERQMVELAVAVARRVVHREVSLDPDLLIAMARVALDRLGDAAKITVRLNPDDFHVTGAARVTQLTASNVTVVADGRVPRGGCRVESDMGILDAGIDAQIHEIAQALLGRADAPVGVAA
jgi:flagellar assembly protein FliH